MPFTAFTVYDRTDGRPMQDGESSFRFLDRSAWPEVGRVRALVDTLLGGYPADNREAIMSKLRSPDRWQHVAGYFELILFGMINRSGCVVMEIEPTMANGSSCHPDFLVAAADGSQFYVEATTSPTESQLGWVGLELPRAIDPAPPVRRRIRKKLGHYGEPELPLILAVNTQDIAVNRHRFEDALVGTFGIRTTVHDDGSVVTKAGRGLGGGRSDGVLHLRMAANVSAFLLMGPLVPGNESNVEYCLYHNPVARMPLKVQLPRLNRAVLRSWGLHYRRGEPLASLLGLPTGWPYDPTTISDKTLRLLELMWRGRVPGSSPTVRRGVLP